MSESPGAPASLYESAVKIYPRKVSGRFANLRVVAMLGLLGLFYVLPWLSWNDTPLVLFDLPARRFHVFGLTLFPQDLYLLTGLLLIAAMTLFLFTTLAGRLFCGYACPQTVWTEAFLWMEHFAEGDRYARIKLDRAPWSFEKLRKKGFKHLLWLVFAAWTGLTFVAFFVPAPEVFGRLFAGEFSGWPLFWAAFYGFATWGNAGFMREQVCRYMCPYARFQSAMFDKDTLLIAYDEKRGEPRKSVAREQGQEAGDCVACNICVQVCPTGIDIRDGLQYECIACAACVDACDEVMDKVDKPRGLIRYTSFNHEKTGKFHLLRPRMIGYAIVWLVMIGGFLYAVAARDPVSLDVIRDRHALYRTLPGGLVENIYTLKLINKSATARSLTVTAVADDGRPVRLSPDSLSLAPGEARALVVAATVAKQPGSPPTLGVTFTAQGSDGVRAEQDGRFIVGAH